MVAEITAENGLVLVALILFIICCIIYIVRH